MYNFTLFFSWMAFEIKFSSPVKLLTEHNGHSVNNTIKLFNISCSIYNHISFWPPSHFSNQFWMRGGDWLINTEQWKNGASGQQGRKCHVSVMWVPHFLTFVTTDVSTFFTEVGTFTSSIFWNKTSINYSLTSCTAWLVRSWLHWHPQQTQWSDEAYQVQKCGNILRSMYLYILSISFSLGFVLYLP